MQADVPAAVPRPLPLVPWRVSGADPAQLLPLLARHGALLLPEAGLSLQGFEALSQAVCRRFHHVAVRRALQDHRGDGFSTAVFRDNFVLLGHSEGAYRPWPHRPPQVCFFMCVVPPAEAGGETTLIDGAALLQALPPALRRRLREQGVTYECLWAPERWAVEFGVDDATALRATLDGLPGVRYELAGDGLLRLAYTTSPLRRSLAGAEAFANGMLTHLPRVAHPAYAQREVYTRPTNRVLFGDGTPLSDADVNALLDAHDSVMYAHRWSAGDVVILDNDRVMHGRLATAAPCKRELVSRFGWVDTLAA